MLNSLFFFFLSSRSKKEKDAIKVKGKQKKKAAHIGVLPSHTSIQKKKKRSLRNSLS